MQILCVQWILNFESFSFILSKNFFSLFFFKNHSFVKNIFSIDSLNLRVGNELSRLKIAIRSKNKGQPPEYTCEWFAIVYNNKVNMNINTNTLRILFVIVLLLGQSTAQSYF